jgi:hypothetical protein
MKKPLIKGFGKSATHPRGELITMKAAANDVGEAALVSEKPKFKPVYAYFVLFIVIICRVMVQWHR